MTVLRRMAGEKKHKNSAFQNRSACCYGDEALLHLFPLTCCLDLPPSPCAREIFFSFSYFFLLFPHNGGLSQTPSVFLS